MSLTHQFIFGIYPYICGALFLLGSLARFDRDQYTWRSESSQMLAMGTLRVGSNLFHLGIIGLFFGHLFGMLTPPEIIHALGVTASQKQMLAVVAGGTLGSIGLIGLLLLNQRRLGNEHARGRTRELPRGDAADDDRDGRGRAHDAEHEPSTQRDDRTNRRLGRRRERGTLARPLPRVTTVVGDAGAAHGGLGRRARRLCVRAGRESQFRGDARPDAFVGGLEILQIDR